MGLEQDSWLMVQCPSRGPRGLMPMPQAGSLPEGMDRISHFLPTWAPATGQRLFRAQGGLLSRKQVFPQGGSPRSTPHTVLQYSQDPGHEVPEPGLEGRGRPGGSQGGGEGRAALQRLQGPLRREVGRGGGSFECKVTPPSLPPQVPFCQLCRSL